MARPKHRLGNLPAEATSFIGRRRELGEIRKKLTTARLVSLVGPGGVGKTRLALRIAADLGRGFADGAWLVELADIRDGALVTNAVLAALDLRDQTAMKPSQILASDLRNRQLLLVLDNCEHLIGAVADLVAELLRAAPKLTVITTSREPLQVPGEQVIPIRPLQVPPEDGTEPLDRLRQNEAVTLFSERAAAASGTWELTGSNQVVVVALCRRLDGLPLALELAAVRTRVLSVEQILDRLTDRFALLTGGGRAALPRHQTLRTTIDWSYDLLTAAEQILFRRLCVFAGRFTLADVESVCTSNEVPAAGALDVLSALVDKSLVTKEDVRGLACYRLHETLREYASLKLRDAQEEELLAERCLEHYRTTCLRPADPPAARPWIARAIATARETGQPAPLSESLSIAATVENLAGEHEAARRYLEEAEAITPGLADFPATIELMESRAIQAIFEGDLETSRAASLEGARLSREAGDLYQLEAMLRNLGMVGMMSGDIHAAKSRFVEALQVARTIDNRLAQYYGLAAAGWYAANTGQTRVGAQLLGAADALGTQTGADIMGPLVPLLAQAKELAKGALGSSKFEAEFQAGRRLSRMTALHLALGESDQAEVAASAGAESAALGKRELEVARLVADGLSSKQIAARLFISDRTAATHVGNILTKLGFNSRAQVATWVASSNQ